MRILLTGATGFIGSHVARALLARRATVFSIVRPGSDRSRIADIESRMDLIEADLVTDDKIPIPPVDCCIHLAWYCAPEDYRRSYRNTEWISASMRLLMTLRRQNCRRAVFAGTCFEYAPGTGLISESAPVGPINQYAAAKYGLFLSARALCEAEGIQLAWARIFYLYGPGEHPKRLVPYVISTLNTGLKCPLSSGVQVRDFLHVTDVASGLADLACTDESGPVNIGSGVPVTVKHVSQTIGRILGREDLLAFGIQPEPTDDPGFICADNGRLRNTGWKPRFDLEDGLRDTIDRMPTADQRVAAK